MVNDLIGKTLNKRYHIQKLLGDGGHGEVFLGQDQELQRLVALKRLRAPDSSAQLNARFRQEAHIMAKLAHPNIVPIFDVFEDEGRLYLVMEYSETGSLKDFLARHSALSLEEIIELGKSVARALQAAHDQSIIHRDVKPGNVLLKRNGEGYTIQLTDFSIAHQPHNDTQLTQTGDVLGTPLYLAPEQITSRAVTKTDIYALAVMLYLLLAGHHYLDLSGDEFDKRRRIIQEMPRPLIEVRPDVPEWLNALIMQALAKNPAERPSAAQFYARLHTQGTADRLSPQTPKIQDVSPAMQPRPLWLQKGLIAVTTWAVVALVLVLAYRYQSGASPLALAVPYTPTEAAPVIATTVQSVSGVVNVRSAPDLAAAVVGQLADGTAVTLQAQDESGSWFYLTDGQLAGWMYADYLAPLTGEVALPFIAPPDREEAVAGLEGSAKATAVSIEPDVTATAVPEDPITVYVQGTTPAEGLRLRRGPALSEPILAVLPDGTMVAWLALSDDGEWAQVETDNGVGWVYAAYLSDTAP